MDPMVEPEPNMIVNTLGYQSESGSNDITNKYIYEALVQEQYQTYLFINTNELKYLVLV